MSKKELRKLLQQSSADYFELEKLLRKCADFIEEEYQEIDYTTGEYIEAGARPLFQNLCEVLYADDYERA